MSEAPDLLMVEENKIIVEKIKNQIRSKVESTLAKSARLEQSKIEEVDNIDDFVYGHWMAFILISGSSVRVMLKLHFSNQNARSMLGNKIKKDTDHQTVERMAMDFMKEQCNLMAGSLKSVFNNSHIITGLSIPLVTRGFDEAVFSDKIDETKINDVWKLIWPGGSVICSSVTEVLQWSDFNNFELEDESDDEEDGVFL